MHPQQRHSGISPIVSAILLIIIITAGTIIFYSFIQSATSSTGSQIERAESNLRGFLKIESYRIGPGYLLIYLRSIGGDQVIDNVYIKDARGNILGTYTFKSPVSIPEGELRTVSIPLFTIQGLQEYKGRIQVFLSTSTGASSVSTTIDLGKAVENPSLKLALLAGRTRGDGGWSCSVGDRSLNKDYIHWIYLNLATGKYMLRYVSGGSTADSEGYVKVYIDQNGIDLSSLSYSERYALGPAVVFVNPYRGAQDYTVWVKDIRGHNNTYTLTQLTSNPNDLVVDAVVFWEDLWWPGTSASLDNYIDHVVRVSVFYNNTARIEIIHASGCYLHFFIYNPTNGLPEFDSIPSLVQSYMDNSYTLPSDLGIVYVKTHGAGVPVLNSYDIWDPVNGVWVSSWPPVFRSG
ncbi:MAG: hypothetical protein F7C32_03480 [Desulfurococcales archaeon]|nr:hypothetical protein [Desulfurococcales archaeon]